MWLRRITFCRTRPFAANPRLDFDGDRGWQFAGSLSMDHFFQQQTRCAFTEFPNVPFSEVRSAWQVKHATTRE
jgi:hypothetical protein